MAWEGAGRRHSGERAGLRGGAWGGVCTRHNDMIRAWPGLGGVASTGGAGRQKARGSGAWSQGGGRGHGIGGKALGTRAWSMGDDVVIGGRGPVAGRGQWAGPKGPRSRPRERAGDTGARAPSGARAGSWAPGEALGLRPGWGVPPGAVPIPPGAVPPEIRPRRIQWGFPVGAELQGLERRAPSVPRQGRDNQWPLHLPGPKRGCTPREPSGRQQGPE